MLNKMKNQKGFTLIELMIVVAIIGILAAIAIPNFLRYQLKSKTAEAKTNIGAIKTSEEAYKAEKDKYIAAVARPASVVKGSKNDWGTLATPDGFDNMGYAPASKVYYQYTVTLQDNGLNMTVNATADLDGDSKKGVYTYTSKDGKLLDMAPGKF